MINLEDEIVEICIITITHKVIKEDITCNSMFMPEVTANVCFTADYFAFTAFATKKYIDSTKKLSIT